MNSMEESSIRHKIIFQLSIYIDQQIYMINLFYLCPHFPS